MRSVHAFRGGIVLSVLVAAASAAADETERVDLQYRVSDAARGCPKREALVADIARQLEDTPPIDAAPTVVAVTIAEGPRGLRATIVIDEGGSFSQSIDAGRDTCASLASAAAHAVVLAVERLEDARRATVATPPPPDEPAVAPRPRRPRAAPRAAPAPRARVPEVDTHAGATVSRGFVPAIGGALLVGASVRKAWWILGVDLGAFGPARLVTEPDARGESIKSARVAGRVASFTPCAARGRWFGCAVVDLVDLTATGLASAAPQTAVVPYVGARVGYGLPLGRPWTLEVHLGGQAPASRTEVRSGGELLWRAPAFAAEIGFRVRMQIL